LNSRHTHKKTNTKTEGTAVKEVQSRKVLLQDGRSIDYGLIVWSTGFGSNDLIKKLTLKKEGSRLATDPQLRVIRGENPLADVYALGDCATVQGKNHAATAQMAKQKAFYLSKGAFLSYRAPWWHSQHLPVIELKREARGDAPKTDAFEYHHAGAMAYIGGWRALFDAEVKISGFSAWLVWRSAYLSMTVSLKNKILIPMYWFLTFLFGRDTTRF